MYKSRCNYFLFSIFSRFPFEVHLFLMMFIYVKTSMLNTRENTEELPLNKGKWSSLTSLLLLIFASG